MADVTIANDREHHRYVMTADGAQVGFAQYRDQPGAIVVTHAEIDDTLGGQGLGSRLAAFLLQDARDRDLDVVPQCPFVREYMARHPEHRDLVPEQRRAEFGL
ncbi:MAG: GNAT family N-acetyltransferase [Candidatus Dormibacteria bacterium]